MAWVGVRYLLLRCRKSAIEVSAMLQLIILIALICVPILSLLAIGTRMERQKRKKAQVVQESAALQGLYERQL